MKLHIIHKHQAALDLKDRIYDGYPKVILLKLFCCLIIGCFLFNVPLHAQELKESSQFDLGLDSLTLDEIKRNGRDGQTIKFEYPVGISFDSAQFELVYKGEVIAIVPNYLRRSISEKFIISTKFQVEKMASGKILLHVIKLMDFPKKRVP